MSKPTIALIPSGYKISLSDPKVYSILPNNGDGDFDFARSSKATRVRKDGLIEEVDNNVARLDWSDGNCPSLLLEPNRTNRVVYSENFDHVSDKWIDYVQNDASFTFEQGFTAPNGELTATRFDVSLGTTSSDVFLLTHDDYNGSRFNVSGSWTLSVWMKGVNGGEKVRVDFKSRTSSGISGELFTLTNEWARYEVTITNFLPSATLGGFQFRLIGNETNGDVSYYVWGAQAETGKYASSYIKANDGSTVSRLADECNGSGNADLFNDAEGVLYAEIKALANDGTFRQLTISDSSTSDRISIDFTSTSNQIRSFCSSGGSTVANMTGTVTDVKQFNKVAVKYKLNDYALWINGVEVATDTSANVPIGLNELSFDNGVGSNDFYGKVKDLRYYDTALTDAELTELTT